jgi:hypothetical protein
VLFQGKAGMIQPVYYVQVGAGQGVLLHVL